MTTPHPSDDREQPGLDRRSMLRGVAATGALGASACLLGACTGTSGGDSESGSASGSGGSGASSGDLGPASAIPVGGGKVFADQEVVVTQPANGDYKAFTAICTHQGCTVNQVSDGKITCPCHGSEFSIKTGDVVGGPAPSPLAAKSITVKGGEITLA